MIHDAMNANDRVELETYSLEPFYGQSVTDGTNKISYILRIPQPLDSEQMKAVLMVIKEMRAPRDYISDRIEVRDWRKSK